MENGQCVLILILLKRKRLSILIIQCKAAEFTIGTLFDDQPYFRCSDHLPEGCDRCDDICAKKDGRKGKDDYKIKLPESKGYHEEFYTFLLMKIL